MYCPQHNQLETVEIIHKTNGLILYCVISVEYIPGQNMQYFNPEKKAMYGWQYNFSATHKRTNVHIINT